MANNSTSATALVAGVVSDKKNDTIIQAVDDDGSSSSSSSDSDSDSEGMERVPLTSSSHHTRTSSSSSDRAAAVDHHKQPMMVLAQLLSLTIGMLVARASFAVMKTTDSAILGHVSTAALEASSVSDMYTGCTGVLAQGGVLGTFVSQAMGASNPKLAGAWLQVALVVTLSLSVPVAMLWTVTGPATRGLFGASNHIANMASYYAIVLATALPGRAAFTAVAQYFGAQRIVKPVSEAGIVGASLNLLVGLPVVLAPLHLGFAACPWVTSLVTYVQLAYLLYTAVHRQKLHATSWPGWDVRAHVTACGYILLCVLLAGIIYRAEWDAVVADAQRRSESTVTKTTMELGSSGGGDDDDDGGVNEL